MTTETEIWEWGKGGYYRLLRAADGSLSIPEGRESWEAVCKYGPDDLLDLETHA